MLACLGSTIGQKIIPVGLAPNYRIYPGSVTQTEVFMVNSPLDPDILFAACNTLTFIPFFVSEGIYVSADGGASWQGNDTCTGEPVAFHGGDPGIVIDRNGTFILTRIGRPPFIGLYSHYSNDHGQTWSSQKAISTDDLERATLASDDVPGNDFYGRTYAVWIKFAFPFPLMMAFTDDGGQTWSTPQQVNNPANRSAGGDVAITRDGTVYACWAGVAESSPFREILAGFAASTDGGTTWNVTENAFPMYGITGILTNKANIRVNGLPSMAVDTTNGPRSGWIYIVTGEKDLAPAGSDPDIILHRSADGGTTWSQAIRVNQDELNNGKTQYFPTVHVDPYGVVNVIFYDDRTTTNDSCGVFLARSEDGGDTWTEYEISDHHFKPLPIGGLGQGYQGDNIDITSTKTKLWPVWMDNSTGIYQVWTAPVDFAAIPVPEIIPPEHAYRSLRAFPNPFYDKIILSFRLEKESNVSLKIFDVLGRDLKVLDNQMLKAGEHQVIVYAEEFLNEPRTGNLLFCTLTAGERSEAVKLIFNR